MTFDISLAIVCWWWTLSFCQKYFRSSLVAQWVKILCCHCCGLGYLWPGNFHMPWVWLKKKVFLIHPCSFFFFWLHLQHMKFYGPRIKSKPHLQSRPQLWQCWILNLLGWARDQSQAAPETTPDPYRIVPQQELLFCWFVSIVNLFLWPVVFHGMDVPQFNYSPNEAHVGFYSLGQ